MKKYLILVLILLSACSVTDDNKLSEKVESNDNVLVDYLAENIATFNDDDKAFVGFDLLKSDFDNSEVILVGENHLVDKNYELKLLMMKYLIENYDEVTYIKESGYIDGLLLQKYIDTGDKEILDKAFSVYKEATIENYNYWINLHDYISKLPERKKIKIVGIDIEWNMIRAVDYLQNMLLNKNLKDEEYEMFKFVFMVNDFVSEELNKLNHKEFHIAFDNVIDFYREFSEQHNKSEYKNILDDEYFEFIMIVKGIIDTYDFYYIADRLEDGFSQASVVRERAIYENFMSVYERDGESKYFGFWGGLHTDLYCNNASGFGNTAPMATRLNLNSPVSGKMYTIELSYNNPELTWYGDTYLPPKVRELVEDDYTLFHLNGKDTVFKSARMDDFDCTTGMKLAYPDNIGVLDHIQAIIVISNAKKTTEFDLIDNGN
ncbi:erythromycin esterase family protein [Mycoplasmatota bacterium WC44]